MPFTPSKVGGLISTQRKMRILFPMHGLLRWNGGLDLVRGLLAALSHAAVNKHVELCFALPRPPLHQRAFLLAFRHWRAIRSGSKQSAVEAGSDSALLRVCNEITHGYPVVSCSNDKAGILAVAAAIDADIIFPTMLSLGRSARPRVGYIFDFQHRYLTQLFSRRIRRNRDKRFAKIAADADGIVVNSQMTAGDVSKFLGVPHSRILALWFTPYVHSWRFNTDTLRAQQQYGIEGPFLLVSNHFWIHKDHATALRAFAILKNSPGHKDMQLVFTGDPVDHRDPQHYARLVALSTSLGIANSTHFLGLIPKSDQIGLMRGCCALVQPTLFEGGPGGGAVYDAIGLGVPAVVSDIEINREIDTGDVTFFQAGNPDDLAAKIADVLQQDGPRPTQAELLARSDARLTRLGNQIVEFLTKIIAQDRR